jgi:5-formyltetrahydrofolate cyclo-ligase
MASETEKQAEKRNVRRLIGKIIKALPRPERDRRSRAACDQLLQVPELQTARAVLLYCPLPDELDIWPALHALAESDTKLLLPKCVPEEHEVICIEVGDLRKDLIRGTFNILEPKGDFGIRLHELDAVVAPGRAFDPHGNRVGRGAGYYDRFFAKTGFRAFTCGIGFDCQVFPHVPVEPHDVPVHAIVTESRRIRADGPAD